MYMSWALLYAAALAWICSRASGAVTMDLPARCTRFTMVTRGLEASGGGGLASASPGAVQQEQALELAGDTMHSSADR